MASSINDREGRKFRKYRIVFSFDIIMIKLLMSARKQSVCCLVILFKLVEIKFNQLKLVLYYLSFHRNMK